MKTTLLEAYTKIATQHNSSKKILETSSNSTKPFSNNDNTDPNHTSPAKTNQNILQNKKTGEVQTIKWAILAPFRQLTTSKVCACSFSPSKTPTEMAGAPKRSNPKNWELFSETSPGFLQRCSSPQSWPSLLLALLKLKVFFWYLAFLKGLCGE